ncbi:MAG: hypothetical protein F6K54_22465 [Okeania sp. SIO3B5]|uniref:hypothetical protein n=1 Tax=Okeania sp. SIO3B5 TaxID=2607811 RepID=UPI0013FEA597|nr:hypothetical protein [Okeania sp. SIO3B5]NEO55593.1 hypothetical protein [Okeania sp. SIO3B5]
MSGILKINITESEEVLKKLLLYQFDKCLLQIASAATRKSCIQKSKVKSIDW